jgi:hypothetical protein
MTSSKNRKLPAGTPVRVKSGIPMPEFPDVDISGWTGTVSDSQGRGLDLKYFVEWDSATLARIPEAYHRHCESHGLFHGMVCLKGAEIEPADVDA